MILGFLVPWPLNADLTAYWSLVASIATGVATIALAIFAVFAWRAAIGAIKAQTNSDQIAALANYVKALNALSRVKEFQLPFDLQGQYSTNAHREKLEAHRHTLHELSTLFETSATIWRAHHKTTIGELGVFVETEFYLIESIKWWNDPPKGSTEEQKTLQHKVWVDLARQLSKRATQWQVNTKERDKTSHHAFANLNHFLMTSPLAPAGSRGIDVEPYEAPTRWWKRWLRLK